MIDFRNGLTVLFMAVGLVFMVISVAGVIRFPDIYSRLHAMTLGQELGVGFCCLGMFIYEGFTNAGVKILILILVTMIAGPYRTHVISRVAYKESSYKNNGDITGGRQNSGDITGGRQNNGDITGEFQPDENKIGKDNPVENEIYDDEAARTVKNDSDKRRNDRCL